MAPKNHLPEAPLPNSSIKNRKRSPVNRRIYLHRTPRFWNALSRVLLTQGAMREFNRRIPGAGRDPLPSPSAIAATTEVGPQPPDLLRFGRFGGPDLSRLRGFAGKMGKSTCDRASTSPTVDSKDKCNSPYDKNFEQFIVDGGIYPHSRQSKPNNLKEVKAYIGKRRVSLSSSNFNDEDFEEFSDLCFMARDEASTRADVMSVIVGQGKKNHLYAADRQFNHLDPLTKHLPHLIPDLYDGASPQQIDRRVRSDIGNYVVPCNNTSLPAAPNFYTESKSASGRADVAVLQVCHAGAIGTRAIHSLENYRATESKYDGNAKSYSATYHSGTRTLTLYSHHMTAPKIPGGSPEYHMTQLGSYAMNNDRETFQKGAGAYRNLRDLAKIQRNEAINHANAVARQLSSTKSTKSSMAMLTVEEDLPETLAGGPVARLRLSAQIPRGRRRARAPDPFDILAEVKTCEII